LLVAQEPEGNSFWGMALQLLLLLLLEEEGDGTGAAVGDGTGVDVGDGTGADVGDGTGRLLLSLPPLLQSQRAGSEVSQGHHWYPSEHLSHCS